MTRKFGWSALAAIAGALAGCIVQAPYQPRHAGGKPEQGERQ
jgi:hypothetical protein